MHTNTFAVENNMRVSVAVNNAQVHLSWSKCEKATKYVIKRTFLSKTAKYTTTKTSYTDKSIDKEGNYGYRVYAYSSTGKLLLTSSTTYLNIDFNDTLNKPSNFKVKSIDYNSAKLSWGKVNGANLYKVYRKSSTSFKLVASTNKLYFQDNTLKPTVKYYYKVVPTYKNGNSFYEGEETSVKSVKTKLTKPVIDKPLSKGYNYIKFSYSKVAGASGYTLFYKTSGGSWKKYKSTKSLTIKCSGLKLKKTYYFKIRAYNKISGKYYYSDFSSSKSYKPKLSKPSFNVNEKSKYAKITINKVKGASGYKIYVSSSPNGTYKCIKTIKSSEKLTYKYYPKTTKRRYIKVKAYKKQSGKNIYSGFSKRISYKMKK